MSKNQNARLLCSDLDGTLLGEPEATARFASTWKAAEGDRPLLVYSSGRLQDDAMRTIAAAGLPEPDYFITGVGTVIFEVATRDLSRDFSSTLNESWDPETVHQIVSKLEGIEAQPEIQQHEWKSSWFWHGRSERDIQALRKALADAGAGAQVVYSTARDLDILPLGANKGNALRWLCQNLGIPTSEVVVAGDSGNDSSMFLVEEVRGIVPGNAEPELLAALAGSGADFHHAEGRCAAGVLEGLRHYGVLKSLSL